MTYGDDDGDQVEARRIGTLGAGNGPYCTRGQAAGVGTLDEHLRSPTPLKTMPRNKLIRLFVDALARLADKEREVQTLRRNLHGRPAR